MKLHACEDTAASGDIPARWPSPASCRDYRLAITPDSGSGESDPNEDGMKQSEKTWQQ